MEITYKAQNEPKKIQLNTDETVGDLKKKSRSWKK